MPLSGSNLYQQYNVPGGTGSSQTTTRSSSGVGGVPSPVQPSTAIASGGPRNGGLAQIVNYVFTIVLAADNTPQLVPGFRVPDGCAVRVRANNGTTAGNQAVIFVADNRDKFARGMGTPLAPLDDVAWPVANLAHLWVYGKTGDGVVVSVISVAAPTA